MSNLSSAATSVIALYGTFEGKLNIKIIISPLTKFHSNSGVYTIFIDENVKFVTRCHQCKILNNSFPFVKHNLLSFVYVYLNFSVLGTSRS